MAIKSLSIRIDEELLHKLHIVADYEGRSANSEILILIRNAASTPLPFGLAQRAEMRRKRKISQPAATIRSSTSPPTATMANCLWRTAWYPLLPTAR